MPGFDRTGPAGEGPKTGWGDGPCPGEPRRKLPRQVRRGRGRGRGMGPGRGVNARRGRAWEEENGNK